MKRFLAPLRIAAFGAFFLAFLGINVSAPVQNNAKVLTVDEKCAVGGQDVIQSAAFQNEKDDFLVVGCGGFL